MLSCKRTSFLDRDDVSRFDVSGNMIAEVLNTRSLLSDEAGADHPASGSLADKISFNYRGIRYPAKYYSVETLDTTLCFVFPQFLSLIN